MPLVLREVARVGVCAGLLAALAAESLAQSAPADSPTPPDTTRVVRTLPPTLVRAPRLDALSSEVRQRLGAGSLRTLPLDGPADALAQFPGVVIEDGLVHVRGGRPGELRVELDGIALNEPFRGEGIELPLLALDGLELVRGGLEADRGGGLAGTLVPEPQVGGDRWRARLSWQRSLPGQSPDDRVGARLSGPLASSGAGLALVTEARLDDASLPNLRTAARHDVLGASLGWRARNQVTAMARLAPVREPGRIALQAIVARRVLKPFNPMFSWVGWTSPCPDPDCYDGPAFSETNIPGQRFSPYNAADHALVTDIQRQSLILSTQRLGPRDRWTAAIGWNRERRLTSVDGRDDPGAVTPARAAQFGLEEYATSDPFHVWTGDTPYYRKSRAEWIEARAGWRREWTSGAGLGAGLGATHERTTMRELDLAYFASGFDSLRTFATSAPGAYGWLTGRWVLEELVINGGLRAEWYSPGADAERTLHTVSPRGVLSVSPRLGLSFPLSPRRVLQAAYARIEQSPGREYLYDSRTARILPRHPLGNPSLDPATAISYEIALRQLIGEHGSWSVGLFARDLYRQISARTVRLGGPSGRELALRYASEDAGRATGFEASLEQALGERGRVTSTYTFMRSEGSESFEDGVPFYPLRETQPPAIAEYPLSWDQTHRVTLALSWSGRRLTAASNTLFASGFPWTPAATRVPATSLSETHSRRLSGYTLTDLALRTTLPQRWGRLGLGIEVRNLFDFRGARRVSIDGYPNHTINTAYDDYGAHREQTGFGGGAYWNDVDGDGIPGWVRVADPRLDWAPRSVRLVIEREW